MTVHHGAMDTRYGLLVQHGDKSWHPYSSMTGMTREEIDRTLEYPPYGLPLDHFRIVRWTALALCDAPDCKGHDDPDRQCPPPLATCGQRWVAEIERCPRCGLDASQH